jgi:hypothetical protein
MMADFLMLVAYAAAALWIWYGLARVQMIWEKSKQRRNDVKQKLAAAGREMLDKVEAMQKLDDETKRLKEQIATALREQRDRHEALTKNAPPPPPDVHVISEFPPSAKDLPWIARFARLPGIPQQAFEREPPTSLVWARTQAAAFTRVRQLTADYKTYTVQSIGPFVA